MDQQQVVTQIYTIICTSEDDLTSLCMEYPHFVDLVHSTHFLPHARTLSVDDVVILAKKLCLLETLVGGRGSTTQIPGLASIVKHRSLAKYEELLDWLFAHRTNEYIPFGHSLSLDIRSLKAYQDHLRDHALHLERMETERQKQHAEAEERKRKRREAHALVTQAKAEQYAKKLKDAKQIS